MFLTLSVNGLVQSRKLALRVNRFPQAQTGSSTLRESEQDPADSPFSSQMQSGHLDTGSPCSR